MHQKNGLYLSSKTIIHEDDYWEPSEITAQMRTGIEWVGDAGLVDIFIEHIRDKNFFSWHLMLHLR